jgi:CRP-like cAMP-binding protein
MFGRHQLADRVRALPMFTRCTKRELEQISRLATEIRVDAGRELTVEGQPGSEFMIVLAGMAEVRKDEQRVALLGPGEYFGEIALLDKGPRTATVVSTTPMVLAVVTRAEFAQLIDEVPAFTNRILAGLAARARESSSRAIA